MPRVLYLLRDVDRYAGGRKASVPLILALGLAVALFGCGEKTNVTVRELGGVVGGSGDLPDATVAVRPDNPPVSYQLECPWGQVTPDPADNPAWAGNLGPDQIPAINAPQWRPTATPDLALLDSEPVLVAERSGEVRVMPIRVLLHHEVVNMCWNTPAGPEYTYMTYCPLVDAGVHFVSPRACTAKLKFGVSGSVFNWNLVTYDATTLRKPPLEAFVQMYAGGVFGNCATPDPMTTYMTWGAARRLYPEGRILSKNTGNAPSGGYDFFDQPYWDYWRQGLGVFNFPLSSRDDRLGDLAPVLGVLVPGARKAYSLRAKPYAHNDTVGGQRIVVFNDSGVGIAQAFEAIVDGRPLTFSIAGRERNGLTVYADDETGTFWNIDGIALDGPLAGKRLPRAMTIRSFWFAWAAMFPQTDLYELPQS